ncbi:MAG: DNA recombination protein RmuC [Bacteroidota bacterium]
MNILLIVIGILAGLAIGFLFSRNKSQSGEVGLLKQIGEVEKEKAALGERTIQQKMQLETVTINLDEERKITLDLNWQIAQLKTTNENITEKLGSQKMEMEELQKKFKTEFENIANKILEEKSSKFTEQNKTNLDIILNPLKEKIKEFEEKVERSYKIESTERISLKEQIKLLMDQNKALSTEANNLTRALKGDVKKQGNWGEVILERILERSGLIKDQEYKTQVSSTNEEGRRIQPDVVVFLPDEKHIVIDAKVSLIAYEAMVNSATDDERAANILLHISSVKNHIKLLSEKNYQHISAIDSPDFVLLFMPIESSFSSALQADNELYNFAWDRKIVMVSPTTLLATLRTIASIWKQERQTRNALEIAERAGRLYDKFAGFTDDMLKVGSKLIDSKSSYDDAMKKLSEGSGNLVSSVEKIKSLGAKASKSISPKLLERAENED